MAVTPVVTETYVLAAEPVTVAVPTNAAPAGWHRASRLALPAGR